MTSSRSRMKEEQELIRVFIGYDPREAIAFHVLSHSIHVRASRPVSITPLALSQLRGTLTRERHPLQSTDFSFSRFLVPYLAGYRGWALFMDCDMLMLEDIAKLWALRDERFAAMVVKHDHIPTDSRKFLGQPQTPYAKKNWSSVMLMNCGKCTALTPEYINQGEGLALHRFEWLGDDALIGEIPHQWNHLVDVDPTVDASQLSNIHYTDGGPYFAEYRQCSYADLWFAERERMLYAARSKAARG